jgi:hypothetical protein
LIVHQSFATLRSETQRNGRKYMSNAKQSDAETVNLPQRLLDLLKELPTNSDRRAGAALVKQFFFDVSPRTLEAWPLPTRRVNGRAITPTAKLFEEAHRRLEAAPLVIGGRRSAGRKKSRAPAAASVGADRD